MSRWIAAISIASESARLSRCESARDWLEFRGLREYQDIEDNFYGYDSQNLNSRRIFSLQKISRTGLPCKFSVFDNRPAARKDGLRDALHANPLKHGVVHAHVMSFGADDLLFVGIEDDQIRIGADRHGSFSGIEAEKFGRRC